MDFPAISQSLLELSPEFGSVQLVLEVRLAVILHCEGEFLGEDVKLRPPGKQPFRLCPVINTYVLDGL